MPTLTVNPEVNLLTDELLQLEVNPVSSRIGEDGKAQLGGAGNLHFGLVNWGNQCSCGVKGDMIKRAGNSAGRCAIHSDQSG